MTGVLLFKVDKNDRGITYYSKVDKNDYGSTR